MSPYLDYLTQHLNAKFQERRYFSAPESTLATESIGVALNFLSEASWAKDYSLLIKSITELEKSIQTVFSKLIGDGYLEDDNRPEIISESISYAILNGFLSTLSASAFSADKLPDDIVKQVIEAHPIRSSKDRLLSFFSFHSRVLSEQIKNGAYTRKLLNPDVLTFSDEEKAYFVLSGALIYQDESDILNIKNLPDSIRFNPLIMGLNRQNGPTSSVTSKPSVYPNDVLRVNRYHDRAFFSVAEAVVIDYLKRASIDRDFGEGASPYRRSIPFNEQAKEVIELAFSNTLLPTLVSEAAILEGEIIRSSTSFYDLKNSLCEIQIESRKTDHPGFAIQNIADHSYLIKAIAERIIDIADEYAPDGSGQLHLFTPLQKPKITQAKRELDALNHLLSSKSSYIDTKKLSFCLEHMDVEPLNRLMNYLLNTSASHFEGNGLSQEDKDTVVSDLLSSLPLKTLVAITKDPNTHDDLVEVIAKLCSSTDVNGYLTQVYHVEQAIGESYGELQLRRPDLKLIDELTGIASNRLLNADNILSKFLEVANSPKQLTHDHDAPAADVSFLSTATL
jgi:hypothetical protein